MLCIIMLRKKINTLKAYQIIISLTNRNMMGLGKFTDSSNDVCNHILINRLRILQENRSRQTERIKHLCHSLYRKPFPAFNLRNLSLANSYPLAKLFLSKTFAKTLIPDHQTYISYSTCHTLYFSIHASKYKKKFPIRENL